MSLPEMQRGFAASILCDDSTLIRHRIGAGRFGAERHWQIYRNNVYSSLSEALQSVYPVVARLVGADCFQGCSYHYVRQAPPASGNLHDFGAHFSEFLASFEPVRALAYLPDVARLEWAWHRAFHAADATPLAIEALATIPPDGYGALRFRLHPSAQLLASAYPLLRIWQVSQPDVSAEERVDLSEGGVQLLIVRRDISVEVEALGAGDYALLRAIANGIAFADVAAAAASAEADFDLTVRLRRWVQDQTIVGFDTD